MEVSSQCRLANGIDNLKAAHGPQQTSKPATVKVRDANNQILS